MASKRQTTMAKMAREQAVRERRQRKQEKRDLRRAAKLNPESVDVAVDGGVDAVEDASAGAPGTDERLEPAPSS